MSSAGFGTVSSDNNSTATFNRWENRAKGPWHALLAVAAVGHLVANAVLTAFLLTVSQTNYPGGDALALLHQLESPADNLTVHIDTLAAQTGVSRFGQVNENWRSVDWSGRKSQA